jgi:hypothetical protein
MGSPQCTGRVVILARLADVSLGMLTKAADKTTRSDYAPFAREGSLGKVHQLFGDNLARLLSESGARLVA